MNHLGKGKIGIVDKVWKELEEKTSKEGERSTSTKTKDKISLSSVVEGVVYVSRIKGRVDNVIFF